MKKMNLFIPLFASTLAFLLPNESFSQSSTSISSSTLTKCEACKKFEASGDTKSFNINSCRIYLQICGSMNEAGGNGPIIVGSDDTVRTASKRTTVTRGQEVNVAITLNKVPTMYGNLTPVVEFLDGTKKAVATPQKPNFQIYTFDKNQKLMGSKGAKELETPVQGGQYILLNTLKVPTLKSTEVAYVKVKLLGTNPKTRRAEVIKTFTQVVNYKY